jgi:hypothetical protein
LIGGNCILIEENINTNSLTKDFNESLGENEINNNGNKTNNESEGLQNITVQIYSVYITNRTNNITEV